MRFLDDCLNFLSVSNTPQNINQQQIIMIEQPQLLEPQLELKVLRDLRDINLARKELEQLQAESNKKFKRGIKLLRNEAAVTESHIDDGSVMEGCEAWNIRSPQIKELIDNPSIDNIPADNNV